MCLNKINTAFAKRKTARAKIFLNSGLGSVLINNKTPEVYFKNFKEEFELIYKPYKLLNLTQQYHLNIKVCGGGLKAQLSAIILAFSKLLSQENINYRQILKKHLLLRSDSRIKERRKYGLKKARKASQYSKR
jgi:small subunit ribosomal protein S9